MAAHRARKRLQPVEPRPAVHDHAALLGLHPHHVRALHYAYEYYPEHRGKGGGLRFPGTAEPGYWDFLYLAFAIGTATQVSDVEVISRAIWQTVTAHGIVAFVFNVTR
ncbi:DUF1345 domain-containing protein [Methyloceanibacter sp.]|uniref:DUF1345 domain-containing protein n=1 Tax=Methyloceanibacter sp. TaxID=1965321 RepID=UPI00351BC09B